MNQGYIINLKNESFVAITSGKIWIYFSDDLGILQLEKICGGSSFFAAAIMNTLAACAGTYSARTYPQKLWSAGRILYRPQA